MEQMRNAYTILTGTTVRKMSSVTGSLNSRNFGCGLDSTGTG
jgi:hypothetical protein